MKKKLLSILLSAVLTASVIPAVHADVDYAAILRERTAMVNETDFDLYVEGSVDNAPYYGAKYEPRGGAYLGATADEMDQYIPTLDLLSYIQNYDNDDLWWPGREIAAKNNIMTLVGWTFEDPDSFDAGKMRKTLNNLAAYKKPMFIRFANEMNTNELGSDPKKYVDIFRKAADIIHEYPNFAVVWSPDDIGALDKPFDVFYPGDEYVDWIGVSCYSKMWLGEKEVTEEDIMVDFMRGQYSWTTNRVKPIIKFMDDNGINKPLMLSESGVATSHGEEWAAPRLGNLMYNTLMKYPQIKMINYYNTRREDEPEQVELLGHDYAMNIFKAAAKCGAYINEPNGSPQFMFSKAENGDTLTAGQDGKVNLYTLAYIPNKPNITVEYKLDGNWYHNSKEIPYKCRLDLGNISDGDHTISIDSEGESKSYTFTKRGKAIRFGGEPISEAAAQSTPKPAEQSTPKPTAQETPKPAVTSTPEVKSPVRGVSKFSDILPTHWALPNINKIIDMGAFSGYEDGTFRPDSQITHEEFLKVVMSLICKGDIIPAPKEYVYMPDNGISSPAYWSNRWAPWAQPYLSAAMAIGLMTKRDFDIGEAETPITRGEMSKIISRAMEYLGEDIPDASKAAHSISDWNSIDDEYKPYVAQAYSKGILSGYVDGTFSADKSLTRGEASAVILRLVDKSERTQVK